MADPNNIGMCCDWQAVRNQGYQQVVIQRQGWKITGIVEGLREDDLRYMVRSNFGNGNENDMIFPGNVTNLYVCPDQNVEMQGGRKKKSKKSRKGSKKSRKASKKSRKH
jgi:hypothetical protein